MYFQYSFLITSCSVASRLHIYNRRKYKYPLTLKWITFRMQPQTPLYLPEQLFLILSCCALWLLPLCLDLLRLQEDTGMLSCRDAVRHHSEFHCKRHGLSSSNYSTHFCHSGRVTCVKIRKLMSCSLPHSGLEKFKSCLRQYPKGNNKSGAFYLILTLLDNSKHSRF